RTRRYHGSGQRVRTRALPRAQVIAAGRITLPVLHEVHDDRLVDAVRDREAMPDLRERPILLAHRIQCAEVGELTLAGLELGSQLGRRDLRRRSPIKTDGELELVAGPLDLHLDLWPEPSRRRVLPLVALAARGGDERLELRHAAARTGRVVG